LQGKLLIPDNATSMCVSLDGVLAPMEGTDPVGKRLEAESEDRTSQGPVGYREVGVGTMSFCDDKGDMIAAVRLARAPEAKKRTLKRQIVAEVLNALARRPDLRVVKVADGAADNWEFLNGILPGGVELIDFFHASQHLHDALAVAYGEGSRETRYRHEELAERLRDLPDGVASVIEALKYLAKKHPRSEIVARELAYFRKNRKRMAYADALEAGLPIGSGVVEAACKTVVGQRMKLSGMRWGRGAQAILTMRGWDQSERFDEAWALVAATYQLDVHTLAHVIPFKRASR
jgi:hypothetical protein